MIPNSNPPPTGNARCHSAALQSRNTQRPSAGQKDWQDDGAFDSAVAQERGVIDFLFDLIALLWLRIRLVGLVTLVLASTFCLYAYSQQDVFESAAEVNLVPAASASNTVGGTQTGAQTAIYVTGQTRFLTSLKLIGEFVDSLQASDLTEIYVAHHGFSGPIARLLRSVKVMISHVFQRIEPHHAISTWLERAREWGVGKPEERSGALDKDTIAGALRKALSVRLPAGLGRENGVIEVSLRSYRPDTAQRTLQAYLDFYGQVVRDQLITDLESQGSVLKEQLANAEKILLQDENALAQFAQFSGIVPGGDNALAPFINLVNKSVERIKEIREVQERMRSLDSPAAGLKATVSGKTHEDVLLAGLMQQLAMFEIQYLQLKTVYSTDFPKVTRLEKTINYLREQVNLITKEMADAALESANREEMVREHTLEDARREAQRMNPLQTRCLALVKKVESDTQVSRKFQNALGDLDIRTGIIPAGVALIEPPMLPSVPVAPKRWRIVAVGIAVGLLLGVAVAWGTENMASSHKVLDIEKVALEINTHSLGIVPDFVTFGHTRRRSQNAGCLKLFQPGPSGNTVTNLMRDIETALFFTHSEDQCKVILVSSAISQEGKTFVSAGLSCAIGSREGQKTLVVDADMRRPRLHEVFGHEGPGPGLSTVLTDRNIRLSQVIRRSPIPALRYLTAGPAPADPLSLLRSVRFRQILRTLEKYFDNIVIDSPPVLSVPDYMPLCHLCKRVILVVRQGETLREEVRKSAELIRSVPGALILGVVLNRAEISAGRYSSSESLHSRHHYRYRDGYYREGA
jgi:polysaccharide biosynthesis transport protein